MYKRQLQYCPFRTCGSHHKSKRAEGWSDKGKTLALHLRQCHDTELSSLSDRVLTDLNLHICRRCEKTIYFRECDLSKHLNTHVSIRTDTNYKLATEHLFNSFKNSDETNHWEDGLVWLQRLYTPHPPTFRQSLLLTVKYKLEDRVLDCFTDLLAATVEANKPPKSKKRGIRSALPIPTILVTTHPF